MYDASPKKLVGWKEIAEYLRTSTRTAQRWEQEQGLPVHHTGGSKGYSVFAYPGELDVWLRAPAGNTASPSDAPRPATPTGLSTPSSVWRRPKLLAIAAIVVVAASSILAMLRFGVAHRPKIGSITFSGHQMLAWSNGKLLWSYDLGQPTRIPRPVDLPPKFRLASMNGEDVVIVAAPLLQFEAGDLSTDGVYCFTSTGKLLWQHVFADRVRFGGEDCGPRWEVETLIATGDGTHRSTWCTICSYPTSVAIVVKIDFSGNATRYFVNYGHLGRLSELHTPGGSFLLAGGTNNESDAGALAVLGETTPSGRSPQTGALSDCDSCPPGQRTATSCFPDPR